MHVGTVCENYTSAVTKSVQFASDMQSLTQLKMVPSVVRKIGKSVDRKAAAQQWQQQQDDGRSGQPPWVV